MKPRAAAVALAEPPHCCWRQPELSLRCTPVRPASHRYSAGVQNPHLFARYATLLDGPSPATLTTYRRDGSAVGSPVWFRRHGETVEVVIAVDDVKLRHLARHPQCAVLIFEAVPPFRGIRVEGKPVLTHGDVTQVRLEIASRYLGVEQGRQFADKDRPGVVLSLPLAQARTWDLSGILP